MKNPFDKLLVKLDNFAEQFSQYIWLHGKHKRCTCHICGEIIDSRKSKYSPIQCGWVRVRGNEYRPWICHECWGHRNFKPYIEKIDKDDAEKWKIFSEAGKKVIRK
jgi:NAD-dependent SIR2 family protein deacetylase